MAVIKEAIRGDVIRRALGLVAHGQATPSMAKRFAGLGVEGNVGQAADLARIAADPASPHRSMLGGILSPKGAKPLPQGPGVVKDLPGPSRIAQPDGGSKLVPRAQIADIVSQYRKPLPGGLGYQLMRQPMNAPKPSLMPAANVRGGVDFRNFQKAAYMKLFGNAGQAVGKAMTKKAPAVARVAGREAGPKVPGMLRQNPLAEPPRPIQVAQPRLAGGGAAPIMPVQPPQMAGQHGLALTGGKAPPVINPSLTARPMPAPGPQLRPGLQGLPIGAQGTFKNAFAKFALFKAVTPIAKTLLNNPNARKMTGTLPFPKGLSHLGNLRQQTFGGLPQNIQTAIMNRHAIPELGGWSGGAGEMHEALRRYLGL